MIVNIMDIITMFIIIIQICSLLFSMMHVEKCAKCSNTSIWETWQPLIARQYIMYTREKTTNKGFRTILNQLSWKIKSIKNVNKKSMCGKCETNTHKKHKKNTTKIVINLVQTTPKVIYVQMKNQIFEREKYILHVGADKWLCGERRRMTDVSLPSIYTLITFLSMVIMIRHPNHSKGKTYLLKLTNIFVKSKYTGCFFHWASP